MIYIVFRGNMKRTQLYLDQGAHRVLTTLSRQTKKTVSELVREAITEKYVDKEGVDKLQLVKALADMWKARKDLREPEKWIRRLRKDTRRSRFGLH